ncbi:helix-turn-helix domain-containing protein [Chitinophaga arvensicola]|uniref:AraC-type DNA-binding protein n=1 Tax=Chitinophaga arvensicola TaxID=29529 RepID=A0A1I0QKI4_9BACT|nr:helix-turn-helix domain-containing protein [Chitinophaga arvensicola]SEW27564.1 AraC-type DNA-binding protein [Chitinophaga arvensicola]
MKYIILLGAFQALVVFSIFIINNKRTSADKTLSWFLIWVFIHLGSAFLLHVIFPDAQIHKQFYTFISLIYTPLFWSYTVQLSGRYQQIKNKVYLLFLPALMAAIVYFAIAGYVITHGGDTPPVIISYNKITGYALIVSSLVYGTLFLVESRHIPTFWQSERQLVQFTGVASLITGFFMLWLTVNKMLPDASQVMLDSHLWGRIVTYISLLSICLAIGRVKVLSLIYTDTQVPLLESARDVLETVIDTPTAFIENEVSEMATPDPAGSNRKSLLSADQQSGIARDIKRWMEEKGVYKEPGLTLDNLAAMMEISRHHLSETLNQYLGKSFYQFVNEYRIREVVRLIDENRANKITPNLLSLAFDAGFHSKSSFNQYFKKVTGNTPSAYLKSTHPAGSRYTKISVNNDNSTAFYQP